MNIKTKIAIILRNALHSIAPNLISKIETNREAEFYRIKILNKGFQLPLPQFIKRSIIKKIIIDHNCRTLVETGTYLGDTPWHLKNELDLIYSIELSHDLASLAKRRFRNYPKVKIVSGDSAQKLREIVPKLESKTVFWLDGHFSGGITAQGLLDCPIFDELETILTDCPVPWVILIDDARCFGFNRDYPSVSELKEFINKKFPDASFSMENDIIRVYL